MVLLLSKIFIVRIVCFEYLRWLNAFLVRCPVVGNISAWLRTAMLKIDFHGGSCAVVLRHVCRRRKDGGGGRREIWRRREHSDVSGVLRLERVVFL